MKLDLEERVRMLERLEGDQIHLIKAEYAEKEKGLMEIVRLVQDEYDNFKNETSQEFKIKDILIKR